ncbi:MAG: c-type cytochrome [Desulfuromonadales bacterium]|nr:c-type cytochrome [Desulfuromonadales bacterium]NIS39225.1 c-type cytochrome [Desulfuromonadales bacterium]
MKRYGTRGLKAGLVFLALVPLGVLSASAAETRLSGLAQAGDGRPLQGVVAIETGRLYSKDYRFGGTIEPNGWFSVKVPEGGDYGLHIYATGYVYHPVGLTVEEGQDNRFIFKIPPNPAIREAPVISDVTFTSSTDDPGAMHISLRVDDPNDNLSHQVLAINVSTGKSYTFDPPGWIFPWTKNYPNGIYTLTIDTGGRPFDRNEWRFLAADNRCYNSPILKPPFTKGAGVVPAHPEGQVDVASRDAGSGEQQTGSPTIAAGRKVFEQNCSVCHYADRLGTKVGPGLKGLFDRDRTPVEGVPVTEANIRKRIEAGGENMPPYAHIGGMQLNALILYLKSL